MSSRASKAVLLVVSIVVAILVLHGIIVGIYSYYRETNIPRSELIGTYISNYNQANYKYDYKHRQELQNGIHRLELKADGTYIYKYTSFDGKQTYENSNTWDLDYWPEKRRLKIELSKFAFGVLNERNKKIDTSLPVKKSVWGRVRIWIYSDYGYYFEKKD